jgi:hypothetical protein
MPKMQGIQTSDPETSDADGASVASSVEEDSSTNDASALQSGTAADDAENQYFGRSENRNVRNLKALVFLVLFIVTLAICLAVYFLTAEGQEDEFEAA